MKKTYMISCGSTSWVGRIRWQWKYGRHCVIDILFVFSIPSRLLFSLCSPLAPFSAHLNTWNRPVWSSTYHENTPLSNWGRLKEPADYSWSAVLHQLYSEVFPKSVHILGMLLLYLYAWCVAAKALVLSSRSVWCHSNHVKAHARDATIIVRFASARSSGTQVVYQIWDFWYRGPGELGNGLLNHNIYASLPPPPPPPPPPGCDPWIAWAASEIK